MAFIMLYQSGTTIYRDLTLLYAITTDLYRNGHSNMLPITSPLNGYKVPTTSQLTASHDW